MAASGSATSLLPARRRTDAALLLERCFGVAGMPMMRGMLLRRAEGEVVASSRVCRVDWGFPGRSYVAAIVGGAGHRFDRCGT